VLKYWMKITRLKLSCRRKGACWKAEDGLAKDDFRWGQNRSIVIILEGGEYDDILVVTLL
jgi:hypothetical protein